VTEVQPQWSEHTHEDVTHEHEHYHVTHNYFERAGAFEHLGYQHLHRHEHGSEQHSHYPHQDFGAEHAGEAHEHQHPAGSQSAPGAGSVPEWSDPSPAKAIANALETGGAERPAKRASGAKKAAAAARKTAPADKAPPTGAAVAKKANAAGKKAGPAMTAGTAKKVAADVRKVAPEAKRAAQAENPGERDADAAAETFSSPSKQSTPMRRPGGAGGAGAGDRSTSGPRP
jgi:hypothetical protein